MSLLHALIGRRAAHVHAGHHHDHHDHQHQHRHHRLGRHHHHHGQRAHHHHPFDDSGVTGPAAGLDASADHAAQLLNLDDTQVQKLGELIAQLDRFRATTLRGEALADLSEVLATGQLDRQVIQAFVERRIAHIQHNVPQVVAALGDFVQALDATQQQTVQVLLRLLVGRAATRSGPPSTAGAEQAP